MGVSRKTCLNVAVTAALLCGLLWAGWFVRDRMLTSRLEDILTELEEHKGPINPDTAKELRDLGARAMPVLVERLKQGRYGNSALSMAFLAVGDPSVSALIEALDYERPEARRFAAETLGKFEMRGKDIVPALTRALRDKAPDVRAAAAGAVRNFGYDASEAVAPLIACLTDPHAAVRRAALQAIGEVASPEPEPEIIAAIVESLGDDDPGVRRAAIGRLMDFGTPDQAVAALVRILGSTDETPAVRLACARAIGDIGPRGAAAIGTLRETLTDPDRHLREEAAKILGRFEVERPRTVGALIGALSDKASDVRAAAAAEALKEIEKSPKKGPGRAVEKVG